MIDRAELMRTIGAVDAPAPHRGWHIATFVDAVLAGTAPGVLVECGAYRGVSAAKFSHLAAALDKELVVFDSFAGLPTNDEPHTRTISGRSIRGRFVGGAYAGSLDTVRATVERYGVPGAVRYVEGWFADTLPDFDEPVAGAYLDVDLAASTRTCLDYLWPLVSPGGAIVSQDGTFPLTVTAMRQWAKAADPQPHVTGLGRSKMVTFRRPR